MSLKITIAQINNSIQPYRLLCNSRFLWACFILTL